jgi:anti-sigma B factor antagonist
MTASPAARPTRPVVRGHGGPSGPAWRVLALAGPCDVAVAAPLRHHLNDLVNDGHLHLVLDMSAVQFIDSTGLGILVGTLQRVRTGDGELRLAGARPEVLRILRITGLDKVFATYPSVRAAAAPEAA